MMFGFTVLWVLIAIAIIVAECKQDVVDLFFWSCKPMVKVTIEFEPEMEFAPMPNRFEQIKIKLTHETNWDLNDNTTNTPKPVGKVYPVRSADTTQKIRAMVMDTGEACRSALQMVFSDEVRMARQKQNTLLADCDYSVDQEGNYRMSSIRWEQDLNMGMVKSYGERAWFAIV